MPPAARRLPLVLALILGIPLLLLEAAAPRADPSFAAIALVPIVPPPVFLKGYADPKAEADTVRPAAARGFSVETGLIVPVAGIGRRDLVDTYTAGRSGGRTHHAIDIMAPRGTPILAVADGTIARRNVNRLGGNTLYQLSPDGAYFFYYAHLDHYAEGMEVGRSVRQGEVLGYVGSTGNASANAPHLHFAVWRVRDARRPQPGAPINPYRLLRDGTAAPDVRG